MGEVLAAPGQLPVGGGDRRVVGDVVADGRQCAGGDVRGARVGHYEVYLSADRVVQRCHCRRGERGDLQIG